MKVNLGKVLRIAGQLVVAAPMVVQAVVPIIKAIKKPKLIAPDKGN